CHEASLDVVALDRAVPAAGGDPSRLFHASEVATQAIGELRATALELQQVLAIGPAPSLVANAVGDGHPHVVEEHLVDLVVPAHGAYRPGRDAGRLHVDQHETDPVLLAGAVAGAHQREHPVRM